MKHHLHGIAATVVAALCLSFLIPLSIGLIYSLLIEQSRLEAELDQFQEHAMTSLEQSMENALVNLEPDEARNAAKLLMQDPRILHIRAYSRIYDMVLADLSRPVARPDSTPRSRKRDIIKNGERIGTLEVAVDGALYNAAMSRERTDQLILFAGMLFSGLLLILPTIYYKVLRPVARLMLQAETLSTGDLDTAFAWTGNDELSRLGNTLDHMRHRLQTSFQRIRDLAVTDDLTGMPNRRAFFLEAGRALDLSQRYTRPLTLALIDIDHFKRVNDTCGHAVGDVVLQQVATVIRRSIRRTDICARIGGEEFVICMPETDIREAVTVAEKIRIRIASHPFPQGMTLTASFGLAPLMEDQNLESLILEADLGMYQAKKQGRNRVVTVGNDLHPYASGNPPLARHDVRN